MNVLLVHNSYQQRGGEDVAFEQETEMLRQRGHRVILYLRSNSEAEHYSALRRMALAKHAIWAKDAHDEVCELIRREKPDLVHVHNTFAMISPSIYSACGEAGVPVVQTLHNYRLFCPEANFLRDGEICEKCMQKSLLYSVVHGCYRESRLATASLALMLAYHRHRQTWNSIHSFIALSEFAKSKFMQAGVPAEKLVVKPNFVHPDPGVRNNPGKFVLYAGRLSEEKGISVLLEAWRRMKKDIPLRIIGDGPIRPQVMFDCGQDSRISLLGRLARSEVLSAMQGARFLVVPSSCYENFPMSIVEAYACGLPVIASDIGAIRELVEAGRTGVLFQPGDISELVEWIEWAWEHSPDLLRMGAECRDTYESQYTADNNYKSLMAIYEGAMSPPQPIFMN